MIKRRYKQRPRRYPIQWEHDRRLAWLRFRNQCIWRGEPFELTWEDYCEIWPEQRFRQRGRANDHLVITRIDREGAWTRSNTCLMTRYQQLLINRRIRSDRPFDEYLRDIITFKDKI